MPSTEQEQRFLFAGLAPGREAAQCAFCVRTLSYIFHGWAHYKGSRKPIYGKADGGVLSLIPFEKLGLFWCRLWQQLWQLDGAHEHREKEALVISSETAPGIRFPVPFMIERGKHGKRPQRYDGVNPPIPLAEILYQQQEELGMRIFFNIRPYEVDGKKYPNHHKTEVHASIPFEVRDALIKDFNEIERRHIEEIDGVVRHLGPSEIRALGTHESLEETMRDIQWEYDKVKPIVSQVVFKIGNGEPFMDEAQEVLEFTDEAFRKSFMNRTDYEDAYRLFSSDLKGPVLRKAFEKCQAPSNDIWNSSQLAALALRSEQDWSIAKCLTAIAYFAIHPSERIQGRTTDAREMEHHWNEGLTGLKKHNIRTLPANLPSIYEGNGPTLKPEVQCGLLDMLRPLQT